MNSFLGFVRGVVVVVATLGTFVYLAVSGLPSSLKKAFPGVSVEKEDFYNFCSSVNSSNSNETLIYIVTPTYTRREQVAELTRLGQTLLNVPNIHWILSEDSNSCSSLVEEILGRLEIPYTHLYSPMPSLYRRKKVKYKPRGVSSRRAALKWILEFHPASRDSVIYFADDDNTYDIRLFQEIRKTKKVTMFPVGFIGPQGFSSPIFKDGQIVGFSDSWYAKRKFPVDMAGFAFNTQFLKERGGGIMPYTPGHEEDLFLTSMNLRLSDIECLAENCTRVLVWHTKTVQEKTPRIKLRNNKETSLLRLVQDLSQKRMVVLSDEKRANEVATCFKESCAR